MTDQSSRVDEHLLADEFEPISFDHRRVMVVIAPHPDDEVIALGAAIFDHVAEGGRVVVVAVTDGGAYDPASSVTERVEVTRRRRDEQIEALEHLGVPGESVVRLGIPDTDVASHVRTVQDAVVNVVELLSVGSRPPLLFAPWRADLHPDHEATNRAVRSASVALGCDLVEMPIWAWFGADARSTIPSAALRRVSVSPEARRAKRLALDCHRSQLDSLSGGRPPVLSREFLETFDRSAEVVIV